MTFDGASVNRRLIKIHAPKEKLLHKVSNPYATDGRDLLFFSDPPHPLATVGLLRHGASGYISIKYFIS